MEKRSVVVSVFGRQFPASVDREEAAVIEQAAQSINAKIRAFKAVYKTQGDLDIAIMCCLDIMTEYLSYRQMQSQQLDTALEAVAQLEQQIARIMPAVPAAPVPDDL
ncbi:MAG: cell division protein ZapA [Bacteroidia bacterium]|nr:cell division protein ZapA [Bacteroidia bacterium]